MRPSLSPPRARLALLGVLSAATLAVGALPDAGLTAPSPPTIDRPTVVKKPVRRPDTCQAITPAVRQQLRARGVKHTLCVRPGPPTSVPAPRPPRAEAPDPSIDLNADDADLRIAQVAVPSPLCQTGFTVFTRFSSCTQDTAGVIAINVISGLITGEIDIQYAFWNTLANNVRSWDENLQITVTGASGILAGNTSLGAPLQCMSSTPGDCFTRSLIGQIEISPVLMDPAGATFDGAAAMESTDPGIDFQTIGLTLFWTTTNPDVTPNSLVDQVQAAVNQRCDNTLANFTVGGCVYPDFSFNLYVLSLSDPSVQGVAQHILDAQFGTPTTPPLPDQFGVLGANNPLTRDTNPADTLANRNASCADFVPDPTPPGQPSDSCDEYPFASTYQGAAFVGPGRFSVAHVPVDQNSRAGSLLGGFYSINRIIDGDPFYAFITI